MIIQHNENDRNSANGAEDANSVKNEFAGVVPHRKDYHHITVREEYLAVCRECKYKKQGRNHANDYCKAIILDILENWTNYKLKNGEKPLVFMTAQQWEDAMYGSHKRNAIMDSLDELLGEGLIKRSPFKMIGGKETFQYELNYQKLNKRIQKLPGNLVKNLHDPLIYQHVESAPEANYHSENEDHPLINQHVPVDKSTQHRFIHRINIDSDSNIVDANAVDGAPSLPQEKNKRIKKTELTEEQQNRVRYWQNFINQRRGGPLREKGPHINETTCLQTLVCEYTDEQIEAVYRYCEKHWKYKENPHEIGGRQLLNESRPALALLQKKQPAVNDEPSPEEMEAVDLRNQAAIDKWLKWANAKKKGVAL